MPILIAGTGSSGRCGSWPATRTAAHVVPERPEELVPKVEALRRWCAEEGARPDGDRMKPGASSPRTWTGSCARTPTATSSSGSPFRRVQRAGLDGRPGRRLAGLADERNLSSRHRLRLTAP
jgi:hypothetical protein